MSEAHETIDNNSIVRLRAELLIVKLLSEDY